MQNLKSRSVIRVYNFEVDMGVTNKKQNSLIFKSKSTHAIIVLPVLETTGGMCNRLPYSSTAKSISVSQIKEITGCLLDFNILLTSKEVPVWQNEKI